MPLVLITAELRRSECRRRYSVATGPPLEPPGEVSSPWCRRAFAVLSRREAFQLDQNWQRTMPRVA
jgi:hypothetical protein